MIGILVVSHEPLGTALIHCTRHIFGRMLPQLAALDVIPDEDPGRAEMAGRELIARINDGSGVLVLTDICGQRRREWPRAWPIRGGSACWQGPTCRCCCGHCRAVAGPRSNR